MTTKYPMPEPHVHAELIKAWADGAVIQRYAYSHKEWIIKNSQDWNDKAKFRIDPTCDYAIAKIAELGGDHMVDPYMYWLYGGELETKAVNDTWKDADFCNEFDDDPFKQFQELHMYWDGNIRKKKRMVKQVLWVRLEDEFQIETKWLEASLSISEPTCWHEVTTCTREVEEQ